MLPSPTSPDFPAALKARREMLGLSRTELARRAGIHGVMPRRYEEPDCGEFTSPRADTWKKMHEILYPEFTVSVSGQLDPPESKSTTDTSSVLSGARSLSLAEAKAGLAITFDVDIDRIEITIRG
ncbi:helix-turn-helix transcriptional regulator [Pseudomonas sp. HY2-MNA-CIBAN-0224]|uniref:helix-turn-helix domain-containing protein n=1 Tax=Pseudomonas sp. HY2-MNA-CIBAN-0224 TaxID=3140471 RepID=UPI003321E6AE